MDSYFLDIQIKMSNECRVSLYLNRNKPINNAHERERERENEHSSFKGNISTANQNERRRKKKMKFQ